VEASYGCFSTVPNGSGKLPDPLPPVSPDCDALAKADRPLDHKGAALPEAGHYLDKALKLVHQLVVSVVQLHQRNL
jgi:hypothetical protein